MQAKEACPPVKWMDWCRILLPLTNCLDLPPPSSSFRISQLLLENPKLADATRPREWGVVVSSSTLGEHERTTLHLACRWLMNVSMRFLLVTIYRYLQEGCFSFHEARVYPIAVSGKSTVERLYLPTLADSSSAFTVRKQLAV